MRRAKRSYKRWTEEELNYLKTNYGIIPTVKIADNLDRSYRSINGKINHLKLYIKKAPTEYAVYKGENLLTMGTAEECAAELGVTAKYIVWMTSPYGKSRSASRKNPANATTVDRLDDD